MTKGNPERPGTLPQHVGIEGWLRSGLTKAAFLGILDVFYVLFQNLLGCKPLYKIAI